MLQVDSEVTLGPRMALGGKTIPFSSEISYFMELSISLGFNNFQLAQTWSDGLVYKKGI